MTISDPVQQIVLNCLNHFAYQDAIFLSERLHAEHRSEETLYLLALSHFRSGSKTLRAYHLLKERHLRMPKSKYLLAKCCLDLNKYSEAESVLTSDFFNGQIGTSSHSTSTNLLNRGNNSSTSGGGSTQSSLNFNTAQAAGVASNSTQSNASPTPAPTSSKQKLYDEILKEYGTEYASYVLQILANVYSKTDRISQSVEFYKKSLRLNPYTWSSFEAICNIGEKIDPNKYFTLNSALSTYKTQIVDANMLSFMSNQQEVKNNSEKCSQSSKEPKDLHSHHQKQQQNIQNQILKQIDLQNDFLDQKNRQEIANMLRIVENDQQTLNMSKLSYKQKGNSQHVHHSNCVHHSKQNQEQLSSTKRQGTTHLISKPLFGQNTTNTNISTTSSNIRRSSRIFAAQSANNAVKENTKSTSLNNSSTMADYDMNESNSLQSLPSSSHTSHTGSSQSSSSSSSSSSSCSSTSNLKINKRIKPKKKPDPNDMSSEDIAGNDESLSPGGYNVNSNLDQEEKVAGLDRSEMSCSDVIDCNSCAAYQECKHCNLLSNQSKNNALNQYAQQSNQAQLQQQQQQQQQQSSRNIQKKTFKFQFLIEQSICLDNLMNLMRDIGMAFYNLKQFECEKALGYFELLPQCQIQSSFVLSNMARAQFELHNYLKAEKCYAQLRREYPYHLEGLEYYSTTLWHLQKEIALSALAQELTDYDKLAPETWCVVGNCFSLHKEHDAAIKFFQRATQVEPKFVYAYNLLGHEYFLIEEMDKGLSCFRKAIYLDSRHYNAWYGISMIHLKQEKFLHAEKYLKKALLINPHSSTLMCHIAVVYHSLKQSDKALQILDRALAVESKNTLCKFHRASILFSLERYEDALEEFEKLRRIIPKESLIYYMISKTHKKLKNVHLSLMYMSWAMDLDPKGVNNQLKESIDKRYVVDSDSTFARELETINTSTLDAIYGGNDLIQNADNEDNDDDMDDMPNNQNNDLMEGLLNQQQQQQAHDQHQPIDDSDLIPNQQDESSLIGDDSEMSRNTNNISATIPNTSSTNFQDILQKQIQMKQSSTSAIGSSLLEASSLLEQFPGGDQLMENGTTNNDEEEMAVAGTSTGTERKNKEKMAKDILGEYEDEEENEDNVNKNDTYDVDEDEESEEETPDEETGDDEIDSEDDNDDEGCGGDNGQSNEDDGNETGNNNEMDGTRKSGGSRGNDGGVDKGGRDRGMNSKGGQNQDGLDSGDSSEDSPSVVSVVEMKKMQEVKDGVRKVQARSKVVSSRHRAQPKSTQSATSSKSLKQDNPIKSTIHKKSSIEGQKRSNLPISSKNHPCHTSKPSKSTTTKQSLFSSGSPVTDALRKKKTAQKLLGDKSQATGSSSPSWCGTKSSLTVPISLTKEMNPKIVIKKLDCSLEKCSVSASGYLTEETALKSNSFLCKKTKVEKTDKSEDKNEDDEVKSNELLTGSILINNKNNDSNDSKFTPELNSQGQSSLACLAPLKKTKYSKTIQQKKTFYKKQVNSSSDPYFKSSDNKTPAAVTSAGVTSTSTTVHSRQIQFNLTNTELSSTSNSMILDESHEEEEDKSKFQLKGSNLQKIFQNKGSTKAKNLNCAKLELKFSMDQEDCDLTNPDLLSESNQDYLDECQSKSELFMSMNSYVDTGKTNDTISFLHQSHMNDSEFQIDNKKALSFEPLKTTETRMRSAMSKDEFMDSIEYT